MKNTKTGRLETTKAILARFRYDTEFTSLDIAAINKGYTPEEVARDLVNLANKGEIELIGKRKREGGGKDINLYRRVKKVTFSFEVGLAGGVWADLYMRPLPVMQKGRVFTCQG